MVSRRLVGRGSGACGAGCRCGWCSGLTLCSCRYFCIGLCFRLRAILEIGYIPTAALQLKARSGDKFGIRIAAACGTSRNRRISYLLQIFLFKTTGPATVFINWHDSPPIKQNRKKWNYTSTTCLTGKYGLQAGLQDMDAARTHP